MISEDSDYEEYEQSKSEQQFGTISDSCSETEEIGSENSRGNLELKSINSSKRTSNFNKEISDDDSDEESLVLKKGIRKFKPIIDSSDSKEFVSSDDDSNKDTSKICKENNQHSPTVEELFPNSGIESSAKLGTDKNNEILEESLILKKNMKSVSDEENSDNECLENDMTKQFSLDKTNKFLSSTLMDSSTPRKEDTGKRLLNKSRDTPRLFKHVQDMSTPRKVTSVILSSSEESGSDQDDVIEVSDSDTAQDSTSTLKKTIQPTLVQLMTKRNSGQINATEDKKTIEVTEEEYRLQARKVNDIKLDLDRATGIINKLNLEQLPDKGFAISSRVKLLKQKFDVESTKLHGMKMADNPVQEKKELLWSDLEAAAGAVMPKTFGKRAMATISTERELTVERLHQLHGSLQNCPKENDLAEEPKGLKVELMPHQKRALSWLMYRENQKPSGGILADDMGLGKTLTMISLMLKSNETERNKSDSEEEENEHGAKKKSKPNGGTLVICPASLINQWSGELEQRTKRGLASCEIYHGAKRETNPNKLSRYDMVITTYSIVNNECEKNGAIFRVKWRRIVIDEAHQIRNHKSQTADAVCRLHGRSRWALTGTPVHNKELDMYSLLKFLRCSPFDDLKVWKRWVSDKSTGGTERLHTVISSLMLRRTKAELIERGALNKMPERKFELIPIDLTQSEKGVYSKILIFSKTLFAQFLHQRAEKNQDRVDVNYVNNPNPNQEYFNMRQKLLKLNKLKEVKQHEILVLLLRLRQICCHPSLITGMLDANVSRDILGEDEEVAEKEAALDLLDQLNNLTLADDEPPNIEGISEEAQSLKDVAKTVLKPSDPIFSKTRMSSKINVLIKLLKDKILVNNDKVIIVSQWTNFLELIAYHLKNEGFKYSELNGQIPVPKRMDIVNRFNNPNDSTRILLLSLTAGGVGLNLVGANHLILLDLHWNPQLESQAQDRIYRMGQQKPVFVYKIMAVDTIEKRILDLQEKKLDIANSMLTGSKQENRNKLTLQDLKMLFEM